MYFGLIVACFVETSQCKAFAGPMFPTESSCKASLAAGVEEVAHRIPPNAYVKEAHCFQIPEEV